MSKIKFMFVAVIVMLFALSPVASGQTETGQIIGKVSDPNGALVAGATVNVKSVTTGADRTATTGDDGTYIVTNLQPGLYDVTVQGAGFAASTQRVNVTVGSQVSVNTTLSVTEISAGTVDVVASEGVEVNTQNQELATVVSGTQIRELPTLTRNVYDLVGLSGNVASDDPGTVTPGIGTTSRGAGFSINGQRSASTNVLLDGADNNDAFSASIGQRVPLDSVGEFRVITSNFSAEYGRAGGGIVNVVTRAGSNDFHGTLFAFNRPSRLASNGFNNNANGLPKPVFVRNQFGYALGGRIIRDKLFFFNSTEWTRVRSNSQQIVYVPTPQLLAASNPVTQAFFNAFPLGTPINGPILTVADVIADRGLTATGTPFTSLPGTLPAFGQVRYNVPTDVGAGFPQNTYQTITRIDWNVSDKTQIYGRYALENQKFFEGTTSTNPFQGFDTGTTNFNQNSMVNLTHTFSPNLVSQTKLVYNRLTNVQPLGDQPAGPTLYFFPNTASQLAGNNIALPGYLPFNPGSAIPFGGPQNLGQVNQDLNYQLGIHQFRFGGQYVYIQDNRVFGAFQNAVETLGAQSNYQQALDNFVLGQLFQFQAAVDPQGRFPGDTLTLPVGPPDFGRSNRYHEYALYFNDAWRIRPTVTLNLGLRYEYYGVQKNKDENLDSNFYFGQGSTLQERIRNGRVLLAPESPVGGLWRPDKNNFAPRVGFAWDITGDGQTSLRGGYGIAYERNFGNVTFNVIQNPPNYATVSLFAGTDLPTIPITTSNSGPLAGSGGSTVLPRTSLRHVREDIVNAYAHFWSAAFERQLAQGTVASIEYSGSAGRDLYSLENINITGSGAFYLGDANPNARLNAQYSNINTRANNGRSNYNALIAGIESNNLANMRLQFTARYTYSVTRDNLSTTFSEGNFNLNLGLTNPFDPDLDYGYSDFDVRHRFVSSLNWAIPYARGTTGFARQLLDGWTLTGIFNARTGTPFTIYDGFNSNFASTRLVPNGPVSVNVVDTGTANFFSFIDLTGQPVGAISNPVCGGCADFGPYPANMTRRNEFRGPGIWNVDAGVHKNFRFGERYSLQLRGEFYNLFNHANLYIAQFQNDVSTGFIPAVRGITPGGTPERRNVQIAAKFIF